MGSIAKPSPGCLLALPCLLPSHPSPGKTQLSSGDLEHARHGMFYLHFNSGYFVSSPLNFEILEEHPCVLNIKSHKNLNPGQT